MIYRKIGFLFFIALSPCCYNVSAQSNSVSAAKELSTALELNKPDSVIAFEYERLAKSLAEQAFYARAEEYFLKALQIYTRLKQIEKVVLINRELAKVQESQNKIKEAEKSFNKAANISSDKIQKQLNINDANRLRNAGSPEEQSKYINSNITILKNSGQKKEVTENYKKMAEVYVDNEQYEKAIDINAQLVQQAKEEGDFTTAITQLQSLSAIYSKDTANKADNGIDVLTQAYNLAVENGRTIEAKKSAELLVEQFKKKRDNKNVILSYQRFFNDFDSLIKSDNSLVDAQLLQTIEKRITQLEKERALKDELIARQNKFNYTLLAFIALMLVFFILLIKALYSIKIKNKKIALQSLRREMNPHFIFNSLNSVNQFIAQNDERAANKYLTSYSKLMRNSMENSNKDFIKLSAEIELLKEYLELEQLRFNGVFDYQIFVDENLDAEQICIPNMLIQPHLENAVWHGLRYKEGKGKLLLSITLKNKTIVVSIEDDGIGIQQSQLMKTKNQRVYHSRGLTNVKERIKLLNQIYRLNMYLEIKEKQTPDSGVLVMLKLPLKTNL